MAVEKPDDLTFEDDIQVESWEVLDGLIEARAVSMYEDGAELRWQEAWELEDARRLRDWLDQAIDWLEEGESK